jgi:mersacidin/lichenicidin family type 2 lantibiotic
MNTDQIVKSWKDDEYAQSLGAAEQALLPENPVGLIELTDEELLGINGASVPVSVIVLTVVFVVTVTI